MKYGFAGILVIVAGLLSLMGIYAVLNGTMINEENYTGLKESMEGAMYDAIDIDYYQKTGELKIIREKFVENFTRRFAETAKYGKNGYEIEFYDIIESPPKASVRIKGRSDEIKMTLDSNDVLKYDIINELDAILKYNGKHLYTYELFAFTNKQNYIDQDNSVLGIMSYNIKTPEELKIAYNISENNYENAKHRSICKIVNIEYVSSVTPEESNGARQAFADNVNGTSEDNNNWYYSPYMRMRYNNPNDVNPSSGVPFCEIETVSFFKFSRGPSIPQENEQLNDLKVTFKDDCMSWPNFVTGYKYRVTWECS